MGQTKDVFLVVSVSTLKLNNTHTQNKIKLSHMCCIQLFVALWTVACQALLSMELSRQEYKKKKKEKKKEK